MCRCSTAIAERLDIVHDHYLGNKKLTVPEIRVLAVVHDHVPESSRLIVSGLFSSRASVSRYSPAQP